MGVLVLMGVSGGGLDTWMGWIETKIGGDLSPIPFVKIKTEILK